MKRITPMIGERRGPLGDGRVVGVDEALEQRPGVPMEAERPHVTTGAYWDVPTRQCKRQPQLKRAGLPRLTPVFGTAQPPRGISGLMRRLAYRIPEYRASHWMALLAADRVDVLEGRLGEALASPIKAVGLKGVGRRVERNPVAAIGFSLAALAVLPFVLKR